MVSAFVERHAHLNHPQRRTLPFRCEVLDITTKARAVGPKGPVTTQALPFGNPKPQANLNASILNIMQQMRARARNSVRGNDERDLNSVTRNSHRIAKFESELLVEFPSSPRE